jgi:hypothetical protein
LRISYIIKDSNQQYCAEKSSDDPGRQQDQQGTGAHTFCARPVQQKRSDISREQSRDDPVGSRTNRAPRAYSATHIKLRVKTGTKNC